MKLLFRIMVFFLCGLTSLSAQNTFSVKGKVVDLHDNSSLSSAKVSLGNFSTTTNENGEFTFFKIPQGNYTLFITHLQCENYEENINVNKNLTLEISMEHHAQEIEKVTIHSPHKTSAVKQIQTLEVQEIERNSNENLGNLLAKISGVNTLKTGNSIAKPVIRGLYGSRVLVFNNSVRLSEQEWGVEHAPSADPNAFEHLDVIKGAGVLKYGGDAIGGVIALEPKIFPAKDTLMGKLLLSGFTNGEGLNFSTDLAKTWENRWFVKAQGSYSKRGDFSTPDFSLQNTASQENAFTFSFGKRSFEEGIEFYYSGNSQEFGIFRGSHLGFSEEYFNVVSSGNTLYTGDFSYDIDNPKQEVSHHLAKLEAYKRFQNLGKFTLTYDFQVNNRKEYDIRRGEFNNLPSMDLRLLTHNLRISHLLERGNWNLESGISGSFQDNFPNPETKAQRLIPDYYKYDAGIFTVFQKRFSEKFNFEAGLRYDLNIFDAYKYYDSSDWEARYANFFPEFEVLESGSRILTRPQFTFHNWSANVGFGYRPFENTRIKFNLSRASRTPNAAELFADGLHHSAAIIERGNLFIKQEEVYQTNVDFQQKINVFEGWNLQLSPYYLRSKNFINQVPTDLMITIRGIFPVWDYQQIEAEMYGLDFDSELNFTKNLKWNSQFSYVHGEDFTNDVPLILMAPARLNNALEFNFNEKKKAYLRVENETSFQQKQFPINNINLEILENGTLVNKEVDISTPPKGFSLFHFSAGMDLAKNFNVNLNVRNAFNTNYREYLNRLRFYSDAMGRNFILTLKYNF